MKIDLSKIEGEPKTFAETVSLDADQLDPSRVAGPVEVRLEGKVRPAGGRFLLDGRATARGELVCGRCLEPVGWEMDSSFDLELALVETAPLDSEIALADDELDVVYLGEPTLDLETLAIEQVELELPIRIVCTDDCAGLCPRCGADLNDEGACRCEPEADPRWAALQDLTGGTPAE